MIDEIKMFSVCAEKSTRREDAVKTPDADAIFPADGRSSLHIVKLGSEKH